MLFLYLQRDERKSRPKGVSDQEGRGPGVTPAPLPLGGLALSCRHTRGQFPQRPGTETDLPPLPLLHTAKSQINKGERLGVCELYLLLVEV